MKHMGKWSIVFQKFKTHDKIVSIQILSTTPKKFMGVSTKSQKWVIYIKKKNFKGRNQPKAIQDTHISVTFAAKYDVKWFCCADTK